MSLIRNRSIYSYCFILKAAKESLAFCSGAADVNIYKEHEKLYNSSRLRQMGC